MKWILISIVGGLVWYYMSTGSMGGAQKATQNYQKVLLGDKYKESK